VRSQALRAQIVAACAEGGTNAAVAARLGASRGAVAVRPGGWTGCTTSRARECPRDHRRPGGGGDRADPGRGPRGRPAPARGRTGRQDGDLADQRASHLAVIRTAAAPRGEPEGLPRPAASWEDPRRRRPLSRPPANAAVFTVDEKPLIQGAPADRPGAGGDPMGHPGGAASTTSATAPPGCSPPPTPPAG
jgi:hypothetical protein